MPFIRLQMTRSWQWSFSMLIGKEQRGLESRTAVPIGNGATLTILWAPKRDSSPISVCNRCNQVVVWSPEIRQSSPHPESERNEVHTKLRRWLCQCMWWSNIAWSEKSFRFTHYCPLVIQSRATIYKKYRMEVFSLEMARKFDVGMVTDLGL